MRIQHNIAALNSYRQLGTNNSNVSKNLEKLSSGYKINRAGDDAAGLSISEKMRSQITGLETAQKNSQDGISLIQTAEGNLQEVHSMMNRMVELATQSSNGTYSDFNRQQLQKEIDSLNSEIDRIASSANFNGLKLLDGTMGGGGAGGVNPAFDNTGFDDATGAGVAGGVTLSGVPAGVSVDFVTKTSVAKNAETAVWAGNKLTITLAADAATTYNQADIDKILKNATGVKPSGTEGIKLDLGGKNLTTKAANSANATTITAADAKKATVTSNGITVTAKTAGAKYNKNIVITSGASEGGSVNNTNGNVALSLDSTKTYTATDINKMLSDIGAGYTVSFDGAKAATDIGVAGGTTYTLANGNGAPASGLTLQVGDSNESYQKVTVSVGNMDAKSLGLSSIDISSQSGAQAAIDAVNAAIDSVSSTRGDLGALQNRLDHTISNIGVAVENMTAAESRIRDTDMAQEMMDFTKNNILTQAAQAMLAQANTIPQSVLQLLQ